MQPALSIPGATSRESCLNCGAERVGEFCHTCGQHFSEGRLTLRGGLREFAERSLSLERGLLRTFVEMTVDPGGVVRRYSQGRRRTYVSPIAYLLIGVALLLVGYELYEPQMRVWLEASLATSLGRMNEGVRVGSGQPVAGFSADQVRMFTETMIALSKRATLTSLAMALPFAVLLRLFFRKNGVNIAETAAFTLFCFGHIFVFTALLTPGLILAGANVGTVMQWSMLLYLLLPGFAAVGFFERRVSAVLKTLLAMTIAYVIFSALTWIGVALYVLRAS